MEGIRELTRKEINNEFLLLLNKMDLLNKIGLISKVDKTRLFSNYEDFVSEVKFCN